MSTVSNLKLATPIWKIIDVEARNFTTPYQWYGPIPKSETLKWSNLMQNRGWQ